MKIYIPQLSAHNEYHVSDKYINIYQQTTLTHRLPLRKTYKLTPTDTHKKVAVSPKKKRWKTRSRVIFYKRQIQVDDKISVLYWTTKDVFAS